jgi:hypothetical protein
MKVLEHPTAVSPDRAKNDGWYINWCGVGDAGKPGAKRGGGGGGGGGGGKSPSSPPPPPPKKEVKMSSSQKGLNIKCANWRDRKKKPLNQQMGLFTYCMQQDCEQSMEAVGCRYTDGNNFCYTDSGQNFCKQNAGHSKCNDLGAAAQPSNKDGKGAWAPVTDGITYDKKGALQKSEPHFHCACYKGCVFSSSSKVMKVKCDTDGGAPFKVGKLAGTPLGRSDIVVKRLNKKKSCACICCFSSTGDCYNARARHFNSCDNFAKSNPKCK